MSTIVVLGGGIGGISTAFELKDELGSAHEIVLVSDQEHFEFTPSNPWVAVKWRKPEAIRLDLDQLMGKHGIRFVCNPAQKVQPESKCLLLADGETPLLLDVREAVELQGDLGQIDGVENISIVALQRNLDQLDDWKSKPIITICRSGHRAATASKILTAAGFTNVKTMLGGMIAWHQSKAA